ncbi:hypothetical protein [Conexibacter sp. SYSU D00693]|uniref:hypothetical protein n=1 Tax=Conexibacter sp. SYSU D00693 TaxID=2812560 RepID=UPI00196A6654|nr:hypothetical protein [Conexibacter sp. SYSU D00693]
MGLSVGEDGARVASGLGMLFADGDLVAVRAEGGVAVPAGGGWEQVAAGGVRSEVLEPLQAWRVHFEDEDDGDLGFDLEVRAVSLPAPLDEDGDVARLGGMAGYEQLATFEGTVRAGRGERKVRCLGQRGHSWGSPDWEKLSVSRTLGAWFSDGLGVTGVAVRPAKGKSHADEALGITLLVPPQDDVADGPATPVVVEDPRLSTTYDGDGRQVAAGLELFVGADDEVPHRAAGEVVCGTTLDLGRLQLHSAFLTWRMEGRTGVGRYDVLRRVDAA